MLALLLAVALAAPVTEIPVTEPVEGPAALAQFAPLVASDGDGYFALWSDGRSGTGTSQWRGTRVTGNGEVLDRVGIPLPIPASTAATYVIWTGSSYLVVWGTYDPGARLSILRVDRDGNVIDGPRAIADRTVIPSSVATDGSRIVVGTVIDDAPHALFLNADGEVTATVRLAEPSSGVGPQLAWNGSTFAAVWIASPRSGEARYWIEGVRFDANGVLDATPRLLATADFLQPQLASAGDGTFVLLSRVETNPFLVTRHINADLTAVTSPVQLPATWSDGTLLWSGSDFVVTGQSGSWLLTIRLDREGKPQSETADAIQNANVYASGGAATNGRNVFFAWSGTENGPAVPPDPNVYGAVAGGERRLLSFSAPDQVRPFIAGGGANVLTVWHEGGRVFARRFTPAGVPVDAAPVALPQFSLVTAVVFNGTDYMIGGLEKPGVVATLRVPRDGPLRADGGARIAGSGGIALASDGTTTLAALVTEEKLRVTRLRADGSFLDVPLEIATNSREVAIAANGSEFLVAWSEADIEEDLYHYSESARRIRAARVTPELVNRDAGGRTISSAQFNDSPAVAWNGAQWLVVWTTENEMRGRPIAPDGSTGVETSIVADAARPNVAWDGSRYVLAWTTASFPWKVMAWTSRPGSPIATRELGDAVFGSFTAGLAPLAPGVVAAAYTRRADEPRFGGVPRSFLSISTPPDGRRRAVR